MLQADGLEQTLAFDHELAEARQGPPRIEQAEVAGPAFCPLPDVSELFGRDPAGSTPDRQGVQAGEPFAGKRLEVRINGVGMNRQGFGDFLTVQPQSKIQDSAGPAVYLGRMFFLQLSFYPPHFMRGKLTNS
jgi:hypothetical protein